MPRSSAVAQALRQASQRVKAAPNAIATESGKIVAGKVREQLRRDGAVFAGRRLGVSVKTMGNVALVSAAPRKAIGYWSILDAGSSGHTVAARKQRTSRAMSIDGAWRTGPWRVRGVRGKNTWQTAIDAARPLVDREAQQIISEAIHGH